MNINTNLTSINTNIINTNMNIKANTKTNALNSVNNVNTVNTDISKNINTLNTLNTSNAVNAVISKNINIKNISINNQIITVISNKGGVGKTSIALATGFHFSIKNNQPTLLLELDSSPGDFAVLFDIEFSKSLDFAVKFPENYKNYLKPILSNLYVLRGITNPITSLNLKSEELLFLLNKLATEYKNIVIDTQSVLSKTIIDVLKLSRRIVLVTEYTVESLSRNLVLYKNLVSKFQIDKEKISMIINKKKVFDYLKIWSLVNFTDFPIDGFISYDRNFNKNFFMSNSKKLFNTKLYRQLEKIVEKYN